MTILGFSVSKPPNALGQGSPSRAGSANAARVEGLAAPSSRRLSNGLSVVRGRTGSGTAVVLAVPLGAGRTGGERSSALIDRLMTVLPEGARAGLVERAHADRAFVEFVTSAPESALELALFAAALRMSPLDAAVEPSLRALHRSALDPRNAVLVVLSPLEPAALDAMLDRTVARVSTRAVDPPSLRDEGPPPRGWQRTGDGAWRRSWSVVGDRSPDHYAVELLSWILAGGRRGLLPLAFAERGGRGAIADSFVDASAPRDQWHLSLRYGSARAQRPALDAIADDVLGRLAREGVTGAELNRARELWRVQWLAAQSSVEGLALRYARFESRWGNARLALTEADRFDAVTVQDVQRVLNETLAADAAHDEAASSAAPRASESSR